MNVSTQIALSNPFVGLRAFEENEDYLFFGRSRQTAELLRKLGEGRFLAIIGSSGSGKSSLVKSGLLPAIYGGFMKAGSNWKVALIKPGENPIGYLTKALAADNLLFKQSADNDVPYEAIIESILRRSENGLVHVYKDAHVPADENLLIVVDQFEELFRFSKYEKENKLGQSDAMHFIQVLLTAAQQKECPIYVLLTMRSDFLGDCAEFRGLPEAINNGQYLVPRMARNEIREAITGPVAVSGATITQRLVTRLLNDVNNDMDQLPVLQHAMMRTWDAWYKRKQPSTPIDFEDYEVIGTMNAALSLHADEAYAELNSKKEQRICELMFKALTDKSADVRGTRRPRSIVDLCLLAGATQTEIKKQVEIFRKPGRTFLMPPHGVPLSDDTIIDISHESLMRVWVRLVNWTEEEARSGDLYMRLANSAQLHQQGLRGLLKDPELKLALQWKEINRPTTKWAEAYKANFEQAMNYLEESRVTDLEEKRIVAQKEASRKRMVKIIFSLLGILVIVISIVAMILNQQKKDAEIARLAAEMAKNAALRSDSITREALKRAQLSDSTARQERDNAIVAQNKADSNATVAEKETKKANENATLAQIATDSAKAQKTKAEALKEEAKNQAYKTAPSEYARLIREGPSDRKGIMDEAFDYKLAAYTTHLEKLGELISQTQDKEAVSKYNGVLKRLYFNNDLYEKIYACLVNTSNEKSVLFRMASNQNRLLNGGTDAKSTNVQKVEKELKLAGKQVLKTKESTGDNKVVCSTDDNLVYVFNTAKKEAILENIIPMGARATALDYNSNKNIIYFGLENGSIGFIRYAKDRKNQPVFENALGTPITDIQLFTTTIKVEAKHFLLVAGKKSKVVVYELDDNSLVPDKRLLGNSLPEKNLGEILQAEFDQRSKLVMIRVQSSKNGSQSTYQWNPFTAIALDEYKKFKSDAKYLSLTQLY